MYLTQRFRGFSLIAVWYCCFGACREAEHYSGDMVISWQQRNKEGRRGFHPNILFKSTTIVAYLPHIRPLVGSTTSQ